jgi:hypothetical protein
MSLNRMIDHKLLIATGIIGKFRKYRVFCQPFPSYQNSLSLDPWLLLSGADDCPLPWS